MITINGEPYQLDTKVENEILFLRDQTLNYKGEIDRLKKALFVAPYKLMGLTALSVDRKKYD